MNNQNEKGLIKSIVGVVMIILAAVGVVKAKRVRSRSLRLLALVGSIGLGLLGFHTLVDGLDDLALAKVGVSNLGEKSATALVYESQSDFKKNLESTFARDENKGVRRLHFKCSDKSNEVTVYNSAFGVLNVPSDTVKCTDGTALIQYSKN